MSKDSARNITYFVSDERMLEHKNEWDPLHIEVPERLSSVLHILEKENVMASCTQLKAQQASVDDIRLVHSQKLIDEVEATQFLDEAKAEEFSATKEDVYFNKHTYNCALLAAGSAIHLMETVLKNPGSNGFAAIRPPGHHAWKDEPCGFCIFNNIVICAKKARQMGIERVLIFDWDVHAAQGTQYCIEDDPGIKLISIHRFEDGTFWPELEESAVRQPYKNTINVPLNETGYGDAEYAAILNLIGLPIIAEWKPQLILVSCGYDAAIGDPQGEMSISPGGYSYMTGALASLGIPLVLLLEGGYFIHSVAQGALYTMRALIKRNQLGLNLEIANPSKTFMRFLEFVTINNSSQFKILSVWQSVLADYRKKHRLPEPEMPTTEFKGKKELTFPYPTRGLYEPRTKEETEKFDRMIAEKIAKYKNLTRNPKLRVNYEAAINQFQIGNVTLILETEVEYYTILFYILVPLSLFYEINFTHSVLGTLNISNGRYNNILQPGNTLKTVPSEGNTFIRQLGEVLDAFEYLKEYFAICCLND